MPSLDELFERATTSGTTVDTFAPSPGYDPMAAREAQKNAPTIAERFAVNNPVGALLYKQQMLPGVDLYGGPKKGFDFASKLDSPLRSKYAEFYIGAESEEEMGKIDYFLQEREDIKRRIAEDDSWSGLVSELAVGVADPFNLLPGGTLVRSASKGLAAAKSAASVGAASAASMVASEATIQSASPERSIEESAINTVGALTLGGIMGGAVGALSKGVDRSIAAKIMKEVHSGERAKYKINDDGSVSAAEVHAGDVEFAASKRSADIATAVTQPGFLKSTVVTGLNSNFPTTAKMTDGFLDHNFTLKKHTEGRSTGLSAEAEIKRADDILFRDVEAPVQKLFKKYLGLDPDATGFGKITTEAKTLSKQFGVNHTRLDDFSREIAGELRTPGTTTNAAVREAAGVMRKVMDEKVNKLMKYEEFKFLEDITPEQRSRYLSRRWQARKIIAEGKGGRFARMLKDDAMKHHKLTDEEADIFVAETVDSITKMSDDALQIDSIGMNIKPGGKSRLDKARTLGFLDDNKYTDYLDSDALSLTMNYAMLADRWMAHKEALAKQGFDSILDAQKGLRNEYEQALASLERNLDMAAETKEKARIGLQAEYEENRELMNLMSDLILGRHDKTNRALASFLRNVRRYNVITLLGGVLFSSIPDVGLQVMKHGMKPIIKDLVVPLVTDFKKLRLSMKELDQMAIAFDSEANTILQAVSDTSMRAGELPSHFEKMANVTTAAFGKVTGMSHWNGLGQRISSHMSSQFLMDIAKKVSAGKQLSEKEITRIAKGGIDKSKLSRLVDQFNKHGHKEGKGYLLNVPDWTDREAVELVENFIRKERDETIIRPGLGDTPTYVKKLGAIGEAQFQFQTFTSGLTNKVVTPALMDHEANFLVGLTMAVALGNLVEYIKSKQNKRKFETDVDHLLMQGLTRSGMVGLMGTTALSINPFGQYGSRFMDRNIMNLMLGPSYGLAERIVKASASPFDGRLTDSEARNVKSLVPYQNLFYINNLLEKAFGIDK